MATTELLLSSKVLTHHLLSTSTLLGDIHVRRDELTHWNLVQLLVTLVLELVVRHPVETPSLILVNLKIMRTQPIVALIRCDV